MDLGPLAIIPWLMINEQHLESHVLPPRSFSVSFRARHFVSSAYNELLGVVHYVVSLAELFHACFCSLGLVPCLYSVWVPVSLCILLTYQDSDPVKCVPWELHQCNSEPFKC